MTNPVVLVPLDGSPGALSALPVARRLAGLQNSPLRILHVTDETRPLGETAKSLGLEPADLRGATLEVCNGGPADRIVAVAEDREANLLVMSAQAAEVETIGAATLAAICGACCPVVLVNPNRTWDDWGLKRILALHDGSPSISGALEPAAELARATDAELIVLQVASDKRALEPGSIAPPAYVDQVQHSWPAWSEEFLHRLACLCPLAGVRVRLLVAHGDPAGETARVAGEESADLIVLAWKGPWEAPHAKTLKTLLRDAPCPIMVTRAAKPSDAPALA
jgi:nucleotide-binding universal stress UspA family protein